MNHSAIQPVQRAESLVFGMSPRQPVTHDAVMHTPLTFPARRRLNSMLALVFFSTLPFVRFAEAETPSPTPGKPLDLDSAHVLAARAAGFGFSLREITFPARCIGEDKARGNVIALTIESDRAAAWADVACEQILFANKTLQNGWTVAQVSVKRRCETQEGGVWKALAESACELDTTMPAVGGTRLETRVRGLLKGSGPLAAQARRLEVTYRFTLTGPADMSPWTVRR